MIKEGTYHKNFALLCFILFITNDLAFSQTGNNSSKELPNLVVILADDMGYADIGVFGARGFTTSNLDGMAQQGMRFTNFYVSAPICSPSRASLLTGCYAQRVGIPSVISGNDGINPDEKLLPEILKEKGYATAIYGKWHLGHSDKVLLPLQNGFDEFLGTPYSNDMGPVMLPHARKLGFTGLPLYEGNEIILINPHQKSLTTWYTEAAIHFIKRKRNVPFFLYLAFNMPHTPLAVSEKYKGKTARGLYGDVIEEIDWSVGQILKALKKYEIDKSTWVIFTSDNGPWLIFGDHGGSAFPLKGGKKQVYEGGMRVPCIMRWPGKIPAGQTCNELITIMDIMPTMANLINADMPEVTIDGYNIWSLLQGDKKAGSPYSAFYYYYQDELHAVRSGKWKLHLPYTDKETPDPEHIGILGYRGKVMSVRIEKSLYNLENDPSEINNVADQYPEIIKHLESLAEEARKDLGDKLTGKIGNGIRPALSVPASDIGL